MTDYRVRSGDLHEDQFTGTLDILTSTIPASLFLAAATASIVMSLGFKIAKKPLAALFVGQWVAPFLSLGVYNKMVKQHGSDASS